jgi:hypothetical protein
LIAPESRQTLEHDDLGALGVELQNGDAAFEVEDEQREVDGFDVDPARRIDVPLLPQAGSTPRTTRRPENACGFGSKAWTCAPVAASANVVLRERVRAFPNVTLHQRAVLNRDGIVRLYLHAGE